MTCPACGESRWIYPRQHALGKITRPLTGWHPYRCKSCEWRGWARCLPPDDRTPIHLADLLVRRVALEIRSFAAMRPLTHPRRAMWLIAAVGVGLVVLGVRFSGAKPPPSPPDQESVESEPAPELPAVTPAAELPPIESRATAVTAAAPAAPQPESIPAGGDSHAGARPRRTVAAPPASSPAQYRGSLLITADPTGALVSVDGRLVGAAPIVLNDVRVGSRVVRIASSGYETWSVAARVVANKETRVNATLQRESQR